MFNFAPAALALVFSQK